MNIPTSGYAELSAENRPLALCISRDSSRMQIDGVLCLHWRAALQELGLM